jgi:hypothetical protein
LRPAITAQLRFPVCPNELSLVVFSTDQSSPGLDSSSRARRNIRLSAGDGSGSIPTTNDADDLTDLTIAPKLRLWQGLEDKLKFGARMDLKLPIASDRHGLGTGNSDIGVVGIATYTIGKTSLDFNAGYYAINFSGADFDDDRWFVG